MTAPDPMLDRVLAEITDHLPRAGLASLTRETALADLPTDNLNDLLEDIEDAFGVSLPAEVRGSLAYRLSRAGAGPPVRFSTDAMTLGDLCEAAETGVWSPRFFDAP